IPDIYSLEIYSTNLKNLVNASESILNEYKIKYSYLKELNDLSGIPSVIKHLDFEGNKIEKISPQAFTQFIHLRTLNLRLNQLKRIGEISFRSHALELLDVRENEMENFQRINFVWECFDFHLDLDSNELYNLPLIMGVVNQINMLTVGIQQSNLWKQSNNFKLSLNNSINVSKIVFKFNNGSIYSQAVIESINSNLLIFNEFEVLLERNEFKSNQIYKFMNSLNPKRKVSFAFININDLISEYWHFGHFGRS
ncbi:unnamed protein product, partial [Brachionus calyciflorus]